MGDHRLFELGQPAHELGREPADGGLQRDGDDDTPGYVVFETSRRRMGAIIAVGRSTPF